MCVRYSQLVTFALKKKGFNSVLYLSFQKRRKLNLKDELYLHHSLVSWILVPQAVFLNVRVSDTDTCSTFPFPPRGIAGHFLQP